MLRTWKEIEDNTMKERVEAGVTKRANVRKTGSTRPPDVWPETWRDLQEFQKQNEIKRFEALQVDGAAAAADLSFSFSKGKPTRLSRLLHMTNIFMV